MDFSPFFSSTPGRLLLSLAWVGGAFLVYRLVSRAAMVRRRGSRGMRRRLIILGRNLTVLLAVVGLSAIWFRELRHLGTALALVAGGLAIATKEFWLNLIGYFFHPMARSFGIGERIKIGDYRGDVIDQNMMGTTVLEVGPGSDNHQYTGRTVFIPNSAFLDTPLINETFLGEFAFHIIRVPLHVHSDWRDAERRLLEAARIVSEPYIERARRHIHQIERRHSLKAPTIQPHVRVFLPDADTIHLLLRLPVPARSRSNFEQAILRRYLQSGSETPVK